MPLISQIRRWFRRQAGLDVTWRGDFHQWDDARIKTIGYDSETILDRTKLAVLNVLNGKAAYCRDGVCFPTPEPRWPLLCSLGVTWLQNRFYFESNDLEFEWKIIEQDSYVQLGSEMLKNEPLSFHDNIEDALTKSDGAALLCSSSLAYIRSPWDVLNETILSNFDFLILDKTGVINHTEDRLTTQYIPQSVHLGSYPCWFLSERKLSDAISKAGFIPRIEWTCEDTCNLKGCKFIGGIWQRQKNA